MVGPSKTSLTRFSYSTESEPVAGKLAALRLSMVQHIFSTEHSLQLRAAQPTYSRTAKTLKVRQLVVNLPTLIHEPLISTNVHITVDLV